MEQRLLTHRTAAVTSPGALVITGTHREQLDQCGDTPGQYWNTLETHWGSIGTHWRHTGDTLARAGDHCWAPVTW